MATMQKPRPNLDQYIKEGVDSDPKTNEQQVSLLIDGRKYGVQTRTEELFQQPLPPIFRSIADEIWSQSHIVWLNEEGLTKERIFAAYQHDLKLLQTYLGDFERMIQAAIKRSIICSNGNRLSHDEQWKLFQSELPLIGKDPLLKLSSDRAAKPETTLLKELEIEFEEGLIRVMTRMAFWLQLLVDDEFVGILTWNTSGIGNYHYFLQEKDEKVVGREVNTTHQRNGSNVPGEMMTATTTTHTAIRQQGLRERHTHHLVNAKEVGLSEFAGQVPARVAEFIESVPAWLIPYLRIVTGEMTLEEVRRIGVSDQTVVTTTVSVWKYDPAVVFGRFALVGWTDDEAKQSEFGGVHYRTQTVAAGARRRALIKTMMIAAIVILFVGALIRGGVRAHLRSTAEAVAAYNVHLKSLSGKERFTTQKGGLLTLPGKQPLRYAGSSYSADHYLVSLVMGDTTSKWEPDAPVKHHHFIVENGHDHPSYYNMVLYGDVDLADIGIFVRLNVIKATPDEISYTITPYQTD